MEYNKQEEIYWYWIHNIEGIGYKGIEKLLLRAGTPKELFDTKDTHILEGFTKLQKEKFYNSRNLEKIIEEYGFWKQRGIDFYSIEHPNYPKRLKEISQPPFGIYVRGNLPSEDKKTIAIIGTRYGTAYGQEMARYFGRELAKCGVSVISGMARGIDSIAQNAAIHEVGRSFGVLGCGVDICYPKESFSLYESLITHGGVLSEYPPKTKPRAGLFPRRNRIISGLSDGILVIEAKKQSGTLITVDWGLEQGKDIFAIPGRAFEPFSEGCNHLIQMGAKMVVKLEDFLEEYPCISKDLSKNCENNQKMLAKNQRVVYSCLSLEPKYIDSIIHETKLSVQEVLSILFELELSGKIRQVVSNYYIISK